MWVQFFVRCERCLVCGRRLRVNWMGFFLWGEMAVEGVVEEFRSRYRSRSPGGEG